MDAVGATERATANGKVVAAAGTPVEHATVLVYEARTRNGYSVYCPTCWVDCGKRTITNAEGKYSISGLNPDLVFKLLVVRNGYRTVFVDKVDPSKGPAADAVVKPEAVAAEPSQMVRGRIIDGHGNPVRDVVIEQQGVTFNGPRGLGRSFGPDDSPDWIQPLAATDEHGEFEIAYAKPAVEITLNVSPRAMAPKLVTLPTGPEKRTISLAQGATLRGRLLRPDGTPAGNAEIGVFVHGRMSGTVFQEVRIGTKDDGTFAITNIPAGRVWYVYPKMESLAARGLAGDAVAVETKDDGEEVDVGTINLRTAYTLRGKVVLSDGKPIPPDMHVTLSSDAGFDSQIATVAQDGSFEFRGLSKGVYSIAPGVRGYKPKGDFYGEVLMDRDGTSIVVPMSPAAPH
jgi:hypothetical protein